ncbi:hypothetical protein DV452_001672 [Geotrichum candidum]|nr:hypothetical protein DV452_001672 [Geotrichum candidum]KAI9213756.1 hypothetical protein DS838_001364 [Geotrichum bryndzae]
MTENTINDKHFTAETVAKYDTPVTFRQGREVVLNILRYKNDKLAPGTTKANTDGVNAFWAGKRVLDFACGTGITSLNLAPHVGKVVGIDISDEMLGVFKQKLKSNENHNVSAHLINLLEEDDETMKAKAGPGELFNFDAVVSSLAYHHIDDIDAASRAIYHQLNPKGGWAFVADLAKDTVNVVEKTSPQVPHPTGFSGADFAKTFEQAGFVNIDSSYSFVVDEIWDTEERISWFGKHHALSQDLPPLESDKHLSPLAKGLNKEIEGVRVYDVNPHPENGGPPLYMYRMKFNLAVGQRLEE